MAKVEDERFDRAVAALDAVVAQAVSISPSYEDGLVAGMMDFLNDWFSDEAHRATGEFGLGYRVFVPSPIIILAGKRPATTFGFHALSNQFATRNNKSRLWAGPVGTLANASDWQS